MWFMSKLFVSEPSTSCHNSACVWNFRFPRLFRSKRCFVYEFHRKQSKIQMFSVRRLMTLRRTMNVAKVRVNQKFAKVFRSIPHCTMLLRRSGGQQSITKLAIFKGNRWCLLLQMLFSGGFLLSHHLLHFHHPSSQSRSGRKNQSKIYKSFYFIFSDYLHNRSFCRL